MNKAYEHENHHPHRKLSVSIPECDSDVRKEEMDEADALLDEMAKMMDENAAEIGMKIADLFRTLTVAYLTFPVLEFHSDMISVCRSEEGITVTVRKPDEESEDDGAEGDPYSCDGERGCCYGHYGCDGADENEKELDEEDIYHED